MRLGKHTASITNWIQGNTKQIEPEIGMGATILCWTDRHACTIIEVGRNYVVVQRDITKSIGDCPMTSESQIYEYTPNPNAERQCFKLDRKGRYRVAYINDNGRLVFSTSRTGIFIGERDEYYDPTF
jgi:hypothetical protein